VLGKPSSQASSIGRTAAVSLRIFEWCVARWQSSMVPVQATRGRSAMQQRRLWFVCCDVMCRAFTTLISETPAAMRAVLCCAVSQVC
jgi:hypothetical protein